MSKLSFIRLKSLFLTASLRFNTPQQVARCSKHRLEPLPDSQAQTPDHDDVSWLFSPTAELDTITQSLSDDMAGLARALVGLRDTLSIMHAQTPLQAEMPCAYRGETLPMDAVLFEGEPLVAHAPQDTLYETESDFLFDEQPHVSEAQLVQQAA